MNNSASDERSGIGHWGMTDRDFGLGSPALALAFSCGTTTSCGGSERLSAMFQGAMRMRMQQRRQQ
ncbi:hypothetical protein [Microcoleus sp. herbarium12]|uniref:hypothetical protein n=1 Tax=Microcoleus sp. herbarium12 TaxID=3055437 RepID=UPI002FD108CE